MNAPIAYAISYPVVKSDGPIGGTIEKTYQFNFTFQELGGTYDTEALWGGQQCMTSKIGCVDRHRSA